MLRAAETSDTFSESPTFPYRQRLRLAAKAGLLGWLAGFAASLPAQMLVAWRDSESVPRTFVVTLGYGLVVWGVWTLVLSLTSWILIVVPSVLLLPPWLLVRYRWHVLALSLALAAALWLQQLHSFQDAAASRRILRFVLYMPYGSLALCFAVVTAASYLRSLVRGQRSSATRAVSDDPHRLL